MSCTLNAPVIKFSKIFITKGTYKVKIEGSAYGLSTYETILIIIKGNYGSPKFT